jgi:rubrerythrin
LAAGKLELDRDIICPCYYRDPDVAEYGSCYCALYMRSNLHEGKAPILPIPERRLVEKPTGTSAEATVAPLPVTARKNSDKITVAETRFSTIEEEVWYCKQCGYMVFREEPPYVCPIYKAKREMFALLEMGIYVRGL